MVNRVMVVNDYALQSPIQECPQELLVNIFCYLTPQELNTCALVCKNWRVLSEENVLWPLPGFDLNNSTFNSMTRKEIYKIFWPSFNDLMGDENPDQPQLRTGMFSQYLSLEIYQCRIPMGRLIQMIDKQDFSAEFCDLLELVLEDGMEKTEETFQRYNDARERLLEDCRIEEEFANIKADKDRIMEIGTKFMAYLKNDTYRSFFIESMKADETLCASLIEACERCYSRSIIFSTIADQLKNSASLQPANKKLKLN